MIPKINPSNFTWGLWRAGTMFDLGILHYRKEFIVAKRVILRQYAIGYCLAELIACRPKYGCMAVMFQKGGVKFWTHLLKDEFENVFV